MHLMEESIKFLLQELVTKCSQELEIVEKETPGHRKLIENSLNKPYVK